jgi:hypothetical protein
MGRSTRRRIFVQKCQEAASLGYRLLDGALYLLTTLTEPFDPDALMQDGARCVPAAAWDWNVSSSPPSSEEEAWENRRTRRLNI